MSMPQLQRSLPAMEDILKPKTTIMSFQSKDHGDLLNIIDGLRSQGIGNFVDLPQLIVCGDQSSGKSSVLEAISNIRFPSEDGLCTRFATELILRRDVSAKEVSISVMIVPGVTRKDEESLSKLKGFERKSTQLSEFESLVNQAKEVIGLDKDGNAAFSNDILRVEASGPDLPHLTLVDLPGLFNAASSSQTEADKTLVTNLVRSYMKKTRSIILAVVSAKNDFNNQIVTNYAREIDPKGLRTLGIITKPDMLHPNSNMEKSYIQLAQNQDVSFKLGWAVLKNRDFDTKDCTSAERDEAETRFLSQGNWLALQRNQVGIGSLKPRLSKLLKEQILTELPDLIRDVEAGVKESEAVLERLGGSRGDVKEQRDHLLHVGEEFTALAKAAVEGPYNDKFFGSAISDEGYAKRLRAVIKRILANFSMAMREEGHTKAIVEEGHQIYLEAKPAQIRRADYIAEVGVLMERNSGRELRGTYNPLIIGDLFFDHSKPWGSLMRRFLAETVQAVRTCINLILEHIADEQTVFGLMRDIINPKMSQLITSAERKAAEILKPNQEGQPSTSNHYFIENVQNAKKKHWEKFVEETVCQYFDLNDISDKYRTPEEGTDLRDFVAAVTSARSETDMDRFACSEAIDCMLAYYKVARKTFVDNFDQLAVEQCLLQPLATILTPKVVHKLDDQEVSLIAAESEDSREERQRATEKLTVLRRTLGVLHSLDRHKITGYPETSGKADSDYPKTSVKEGSESPKSGKEGSESRAARGRRVSVAFCSESE